MSTIAGSVAAKPPASNSTTERPTRGAAPPMPTTSHSIADVSTAWPQNETSAETLWSEESAESPAGASLPTTGAVAVMHETSRQLDARKVRNVA
jgi:hypothetical protein